MRVVTMSVLVTAVVAAAGLGMAGAGPTALASPAAAPGGITNHPHAASVAGGPVTLESGTPAADVNGFDTNTSLCYHPAPAPVTVADDPEHPACTPLPLHNSAVNPYVIAHPGAVAWKPPWPGSQWVGPEPSGSDSHEAVPAYYVYDRTFTGCAEIKGYAYADNQIGAFINGKLMAFQTDDHSYQHPLTFAGMANGPGTNVVDFVVYDSSSPFTGLDYTFTVTPTSCHSYTLSSGIKADGDQGFDTNTSFCYEPKPQPSIVPPFDPVNPECQPLPKQTSVAGHPYIVNPPPTGWPPPYPGTQWVGPQPNGSDTLEHPKKWYIYDAEFPGCAKIKVQAQADNQVAVFLNNTPLPASLTGITTNPGNNVIDFVVFDSVPPDTGLDYQVTVTPIPCPIGPPNWGVGPGGEVTATGRQIQLTDTNTGSSVSCTSTANADFKAGTGLPGAGIASVKALHFTKCTGPLGLTMTLTGTGLPYALNAVSYNSDVGVTSGTITGVHLALSGPACTAVADGTSGTADDGQIAISYSNSLDALTAVAAGSTLHFWDVKGCAGLVTSGDTATLTGTYTLAPPQTLTSP